MNRNWHKSIHWPAVAENEDQEGIEAIHRAIKERQRDSLPNKIDTSEKEIIEMAAVVEDCGNDPVEFLHILRQESGEFGVQPEEVYEMDKYHDGPYWPQTGYPLTTEELDWLAEVSCQTSDILSTDEDSSYQKSPVERLFELCEFLTYAQKIDVPPSLRRGDQ